jgi:hypothetical protein
MSLVLHLLARPRVRVWVWYQTLSIASQLFRYLAHLENCLLRYGGLELTLLRSTRCRIRQVSLAILVSETDHLPASEHSPLWSYCLRQATMLASSLVRQILFRLCRGVFALHTHEHPACRCPPLVGLRVTIVSFIESLSS